jgi:predicted lipoprotein with Yx(FWY)xxD motif
MKKNSTMILGLVVVLVVLVGGYALMHKSNKTTTNGSAKSSVAPVNNAVFTTKNDSTVGQYLVAANGMALYTYGGDSSGVSNADSSLISTWPPYLDTGSTTNLPSGVSTIKRKDSGKMQYTYNGMPLYFFTSDNAGQVTGDGVSNFSAAKPAASSSSAQPATTTAPASTPAQPTSNSSSGNGY